MRFTICESKDEGAVADWRRLRVAGAGVRAGRATKLNEEGRMQNEKNMKITKRTQFFRQKANESA